MTKIAAGSTIGIIGGGQLGRMSAQAAKKLGYKTHIFSPDEDAPAKQICDESTTAAYEDKGALAAFASNVAVVTFEFENIPYDTLKYIEENAIVRPNPKTLHVSQNRIREKELVKSVGAQTAPYAAVYGSDGIAESMKKMGFSKAILKTAELGYDGKGQYLITDKNDIPNIGHFPTHGMILEGFVNFTREISVIVARGVDGEMQCFPVGENVHKNGILDTTTVPPNVSDATANMAKKIAQNLAKSLEVIGLLAVEFFVLEDGSVLVNEMAPRPHNSGHWTMDGCKTSQFEQFIRAICGLPLGSVDLIGRTQMKNLIGHDIENANQIVKENPNARVHIYGKKEIRTGRKMGHVNFLVE